MTDKSATHRLGVIYMTLASVAWSTAGIFTRFATTDLTTTMFWRSIFRAWVSWPFFCCFRARRALSPSAAWVAPGF